MSAPTDRESPPQATGGRALSGTGLARGSLLVMGGFVLSRAMGFIREGVTGAVFGQGAIYDAFVFAARPSETIFYVVAGGALGSAFIPVFTQYLAQHEEDNAWRLANAITYLISLIVLALSILMFIFAGPLMRGIIAADAAASTQDLAIQLLRIMLITPTIFAISGLQMGVLNAYQRFLLPALAPTLYNIGIVIGALVFAPFIDIYGLAWGAVLGSLLHLLI
ncbi:MAG: murein biosynthesis integral membrane protein MurJ, partial [Chloroflexi bacterium]|nr:murein biosynthesis integral membrane protein MurJ [Chloroflexota bacterium]